jgi:hypothetical protein
MGGALGAITMIEELINKIRKLQSAEQQQQNNAQAASQQFNPNLFTNQFQSLAQSGPTGGIMGVGAASNAMLSSPTGMGAFGLPGVHSAAQAAQGASGNMGTYFASHLPPITHPPPSVNATLTA